MNDNQYRHGDPLRSEELGRQTRSAHAGAAGNAASYERLSSRIEQLNLALLAGGASLPEHQPQTESQPARIFMPVRPLEGTETVGASVATQRTRSEEILFGAPAGAEDAGSRVLSGRGELELLEPGTVWAALSGSSEASFHARVEPSYLTEYNEIVLPHVAGSGPLTWRLHHSRGGYHEYANLTQTTAYRYTSPREFNGHVELVSTSRSGLGGNYIHTAAGLTLRRSEWIPSGKAEASAELPVSGTVNVESIDTHPRKGSPRSYQLFLNGEEISGPVEAEAGDVLRVEMEIGWETAPTHLRVNISHT